MKPVTLRFGDCLELMDQLPDGSVDLVLADLPYGKTQNHWDSEIDIGELWKQYKRVLKSNGVVALFGMEEFSATLIVSNLDWYKYKWYWAKDRGTGFLNAKKMPLRKIEEILIFSPAKIGSFTYLPIMTKGKPNHSVGKAEGRDQGEVSRNNNYGNLKKVNTNGDMKYPTTLLEFPRDKEKLHDTQKPVGLAEYFIETYSYTGEVVLDNVMGSGTSGIAALKKGRKFIGIEKDFNYFEVAKNRITEEIKRGIG